MDVDTPQQILFADTVFAADRAFDALKTVPVGTPEYSIAINNASTALMKLQKMLMATSASSESEAWHTQPLIKDCMNKLQRVRILTNNPDARQEQLLKIFQKLSLPTDFRITNPPNFSLVAAMRQSEAFNPFLGSAPPSCVSSHPTLDEHRLDVTNTTRTAAPTIQAQNTTGVTTRSAFQAPQPKPSGAPAPHPLPPTSKLPRKNQESNVSESKWNIKNQQKNANEDSIEKDGGPSDVNPREASVPGFKTARAQYVNELRKSGREPPPSSTTAAHVPANGVASRSHTAGLRRGAGVVGGTSTKKPFMPPFVKKALQNNNENGPNGDLNAAVPDGPLSLRTYELLRLSPADPLPEELSRLDANLIEQVCNEVIDGGGRVDWEDIAGQIPAKKLIQEVVVWPMLNPHIFRGARAPPKGILLFGPPGTGKTLLGKAIASNIDATFFSISASSLTSKWIGEGEKMVKTLFAVAGWLAPSVIFIDEIDSLMSARKSEGEHEASRRLKTEVLVQMEGCDPASADRRVLLIGATNRPEELDEAARRRMPKQLYIPLPCGDARKQMVLRQLGPANEGSQGSKVAANLTDADLDKIVAKTEGYSGSDMKNLIQEACQGPVRDAVRAMGAQVAQLKEGDLRPVVLRDFAIAAKAQRASVEKAEVVRYEVYNEKHGAKIVESAGGEGGATGPDVDMDEDGW